MCFAQQFTCDFPNSPDCIGQLKQTNPCHYKSERVIVGFFHQRPTNMVHFQVVEINAQRTFVAGVNIHVTALFCFNGITSHHSSCFNCL